MSEKTEFGAFYVGDLNDEFVQNKLPTYLRLPTPREWEEYTAVPRPVPFSEIRRGEPGVLAGNVTGHLLVVRRR